MKTFFQFLQEMPDIGVPTLCEASQMFGSTVGTRVRVDDPGHPHHGHTGEVIRQMGHAHAITFDGKKGTDWLRTEQLKPEE